MKDIKLPGLGENIESGTVAKVNVAVGDTLTKGQIILELESEKATVEVPAPEAGTVQEILVKEGDTASVGQVILKLADGGRTTVSSEQQAESGQQKTVDDKTTEAKTQEAEKQGEKHDTKTSEQSAESNEQKAGSQSPAPNTDGQAQIKEDEPSNTSHLTLPSSQNVSSDVPAAPSVRRFAREIGINIGDVPGTGPAGRISIEDVKAFAKKINAQRTTGGPAIASEPLPDFSKWGETGSQAMTTIRRRTAERLSFSWQTVPHVTQFAKTDITELENLRKQYSTPEVKLTITPFILKVLAAALKNFPKFNASVDMAGQKIIHKKYIHIGVAVDTDNGLLVPVVRDVDKKGIVALAKELQELAQRARDKKLSIEDMQGGTFTLTNLGGIGGGAFTPIINWPEVAILGVSRTQKEPSVDNGLCAPRLILPLSLSYDHRLIDGADGARFIKWVTEAVKQPFMLELNS